MDLYWQGDDNTQYLFAGANPAELVKLEKAGGRWVASVYLPGIVLPKERQSLRLHKKYIEERVQQWFRLAAGVVLSVSLPVAHDRDEQPCPSCGTPLGHVPFEPCAEHDRYENGGAGLA